MRRAVAALTLALAGCTPTQPTPTTVATTRDAPQSGAVAARFTDEIWPAVSQYGPYQAASNKLRAVVDPDADWDALTGAIEALGGAGYDSATKVRRTAEDPHLVTANVTGADGSKASVTACYSYDYAEFVNISDKHTQVRTSQVEAQLTNAGKGWYLNALSNDHVVPDCQSSKA